MDNPVATAMLKEISKTTQDIGRRIGSPKNDIDDLVILSEGLTAANEALLSTIRTLINTHQI